MDQKGNSMQFLSLWKGIRISPFKYMAPAEVPTSSVLNGSFVLQDNLPTSFVK